jgi:hypothetical protein
MAFNLLVQESKSHCSITLDNRNGISSSHTGSYYRDDLLLHSSRVHVPCSGMLKLLLVSILTLIQVCIAQRNTSPFFVSFILSGIRSNSRRTTDRRATESNPGHVERQQQSMDIAQHPRYRKAILRIGEFRVTMNLVYDQPF